MVLRYTGGISATIMMSMVRYYETMKLKLILMTVDANIDDGDNKGPISDINNGTHANDTYWY